MWQEAEGWALILKKLHTGQQSSTSETTLVEISPSCCFCTFWLIALSFKFRSKMEDWRGIAVRQQYVCVSENLPTPLIFCSFSTVPTRYTRKHLQFFGMQQKSWTPALCKSLAVFGLPCKRRQRTGPWAGGQVTLARSHPCCYGGPPDSRFGRWSGPKLHRSKLSSSVLHCPNFLPSHWCWAIWVQLQLWTSAFTIALHLCTSILSAYSALS